MEWLQDHVWPAEGFWASPEFCRFGGELSIAEMIKGGTTTANDMYWFVESMVPAVKNAHFRMMVSAAVIAFPFSTYGKCADDYIKIGCDFFEKYANDPNYVILNAVAGVHVDDYDWSKASGDKNPEWGKILVNGKPMEYVIILPTDKRKPALSDFVEMVSDAEISAEGGPLMPPYIFNVTEEAKKSKLLVFEVINLRQDGSINGDAPFGNFVVNRIGYHVWYGKK